MNIEKKEIMEKTMENFKELNEREKGFIMGYMLRSEEVKTSIAFGGKNPDGTGPERRVG